MRTSRSSHSQHGSETQPLLGAASSASLPHTHPQQHASLLARVFLTWLDPLLRLGNARSLQQTDVWPLAPQLQCEVAANLLHRHWIASGSLSFAFLRSFGWRYVPLGALLAVAYACDLAGPYVLLQVVGLIERAEFDAPRLVQWLALLLVARVLKALLFAYVYAETQVVALQFSSALESIVFQKALRLSAEARARKSTAEVVALYTADVQSIVMAAYFLHEAWVLPLEIALALLLLVTVVGWAALAAIGAAALVLTLTHVLARAQARSFVAVLRLSAERMAVLRVLFAAVQSIKLGAWERAGAAKVAAVRACELRAVERYLLLGALHVAALWAAPVAVAVATFTVAALVLQQPLSAASAFTALALVRVVQDPLRSLPRVITGLRAARRAVRRIVEFLDLGEVDSYAVAGRDALDCAARFEPQRVAIAVEHATFAWDAQRAPLFQGLHFSLARGELAVVHGARGSGKSSLCALLLGEMQRRQGGVYVGGAVAYCSQEPWLQRGSVRANILFGRAFDAARYSRVLAACGLVVDVTALPAGDRTILGGRGEDCGNGECRSLQLQPSRSLCARIALARACYNYSDTDVFVLDAPLEPLDAKMQLEVFATCVLALLQRTTRVLVTQNAAIVASPRVDTALRLDNGALSHSRSVDARPKSESLPAAALPLDGGDALSSAACLVTETRTQAPDGLFSPMGARAWGGSEPFGERSTQLSAAAAADDDTDANTNVDSNEHRVTLRVVVAYLHAVGGMRVAAAVIAALCVWQTLQVLSDFWLAHWTSEDAAAQQTRAGTNVLVYVALALGGSVLVLARSLVVAAAGRRGAHTLFDRLTVSLLRAPLAFFDAPTTVTRVLARYGDDVSTVDLRLPVACGTLLAVAFATSTALLTAAVLARLVGLLLLAPLVLALTHIAALYAAPSRALAQLQRSAQLRVRTCVAEAIDGACVIRAFGREQALQTVAVHFAAVDARNAHAHASVFAGQWLALRAHLLGAVLVVSLAGALVMLRRDISAGVVGLALHYALAADQGLEPLVLSWCWLQTAMAAPARLQELADVAPEVPDDEANSDRDVDCPDRALPPHWPTAGLVVFERVSFRHAVGDDSADTLALRDVSLAVQPGEKIGIVGRAGAGKSSFALALVRAGEFAAGRIVIDGVDTQSLQLATLRRALSVVTRAPVLFRGSVRACLDPCDAFTDDALWRVLRRVGLADAVAARAGMLYAPLADAGESAHASERQLLCLARALLRESRVVVLDDIGSGASDASDCEADAHALQRVIRDAFERATVFTITRRVDAVLDADRLLVLDGGRVAELDAPHVLLACGHGLLFDLARESGCLDRLSAPTDAEVSSS